MTMPLTESAAMKIWEQQGWILTTPLNFPVLVVDTPTVFTEYKSAEPQEIMPGDLALVWPSRERNIDAQTHHAFLEESLREYSDIWRTLAQK